MFCLMFVTNYELGQSNNIAALFFMRKFLEVVNLTRLVVQKVVNHKKTKELQFQISYNFKQACALIQNKSDNTNNNLEVYSVVFNAKSDWKIPKIQLVQSSPSL